MERNSVNFPTGLLKDEFLAPGRVVEEDALLGPATTFEVDLILEDEFTGAAYPAGFKSEVVVADFANDVLSLLRDYDPVTDSTEEIHSFHEVHHAAIPSAADLLAQAMNWVENEGASRVHFYSAREEPMTKAVSAPKKAAAKRLTNAALAEQLSALQAQVSLIVAQQAEGGEAMNRQLAEVTAPTSATPAGGLVSLGTSAVIPKVPPVSQGLQSPGTARTPAKALQLLGPPPRTRTSPKTSGPTLPQFDEPLDRESKKRHPGEAW